MKIKHPGVAVASFVAWTRLLYVGPG